MDSVRNGWTREFRMVGAIRDEGQIHEGRALRVASVRRGARPVDVTINLVRTRSRGARASPVATAAAAATQREAHG